MMLIGYTKRLEELKFVKFGLNLLFECADKSWSALFCANNLLNVFMGILGFVIELL